MELKFDISKQTPISIAPTELILDLGAIEETSQGRVINVKVTQTEYLATGVKQQVEMKQFPEAMKSIINGFDLETGAPTVNLTALQAVLTNFGITLI